MSAEQGKSNNGSSGILSWILIIICAIVFCGSGARLLFYVKDKMDAEKGFSQIRVEAGEEGIDLAGLYAQNHDLIGWVQIEDTKIDYPVMQTPDDPEYYLHRDFEGADSASGTPFMDAQSVVFPQQSADAGSEDKAGGGKRPVTWDWLIYAHNMKFGTMFHDLQKYDDKEFWEGHKTFTFDVFDPKTGKSDNGVYEIFAVSRSEIKPEDTDAFKYYQYAGCSDQGTFDEYVAGVKAESSYETGITPRFGDQLITLSTCAYHTKEGRMYIVGRRVK